LKAQAKASCGLFLNRPGLTQVEAWLLPDLGQYDLRFALRFARSSAQQGATFTQRVTQ